MSAVNRVLEANARATEWLNKRPIFWFLYAAVVSIVVFAVGLILVGGEPFGDALLNSVPFGVVTGLLMLYGQYAGGGSA